jgi:hypothetical protein
MEAARGGALPNQPNFLDRLSNALSPSANRKRAEDQAAAVNLKAKEQNASNTLAAANMKAKEQNASNALASANSKSKPQATLTSAKPAAKPGQATMAAGPSQDKLNATQRSAEKSGPDTDTMKKGIAAGSPAMSSVDTTNRQAAADKPVEAPTASGSGSSSYTSSAGNAADKPVEKSSSSSYTSSAGNADNNPVEKPSSSSYTSSAGNADNNPVEKPQASATPAPSPAVDNTVKSGSGGTVTTSDGSPLKTRTDDEIAKQNKKGRGAAMESVNKKFNISDALYQSVMEVMKGGKEGSVPRNEKEKDLAKFHGDPKRITHGDVLKARGVTKEEVEQQDEAMSHQAATTMKHIPNPSPALKKAAKDIKPGVSGYRDRIAMLKAGGVKEEAEKVEEGMVDTVKTSVKKVAKKAFKALTGGSDKEQLQALRKRMGMKENKDTPGNSYEHQCAIHVKSESFGEGRTISTQHADPDADGNIAWYDVMFEHGIEKQVPSSDLEILVSEMHMHSKKKKAM